MLEVYYPYCLPFSAFLEISSLNEPVDCSDECEDLVLEVIDTLPDLTQDTESDYIHNEALRRVKQYFDSLPSRMRMIVSLYFWEEMSQPDIAAYLGISQSAVSQAITKAIKMARQHFGTAVH